MTTREEIVAIAREFIGVRFAHQGRNAEEGLDCLGFLFAVAKHAGIQLRGLPAIVHDVRNYGSRPDSEFLRHQLATLLIAREKDDVALADILLLKVDGRAQHLALVSDYPRSGELGLIHAYAPARKVVEHRLDEGWRSAIAGIYRLPE